MRTMRAKDYELIAVAIHRTKTVESMDKNSVRRIAKDHALNLLIIDLTATLAHADPKFDKDKFYTACGM